MAATSKIIITATTNSPSYSKDTSVTNAREKPPLTNTGRLIQPNNLLKVFTANVQSLLPKVYDLIALIQI